MLGIYYGIYFYYIDIYFLAAPHRARVFWHQCVPCLTGRGPRECRSIKQKFLAARDSYMARPASNLDGDLWRGIASRC